MAHKGLRKTESIMPWKTLILAFPVIMVWSYWDIKQDIAALEQNQAVLVDNQAVLVEAIIDTQQAVSGSQEGPAPAQVPEQQPELEIRPEAQVLTVSNRRPRLEIVRTKERLRYKKIDVFCLAKNIYHEAGVEPVLGKYAVAQVTLNRMRNPKYPSTVCDVVMDPYQFSWANDRSIRWTRPRGRLWQDSVRIAEAVIFRGYRVRGLESANYYHADYVSPRWRKPEAKIAKVGAHIFYASAR